LYAVLSHVAVYEDGAPAQRIVKASDVMVLPVAVIVKSSFAVFTSPAVAPQVHVPVLTLPGSVVEVCVAEESTESAETIVCPAIDAALTENVPSAAETYSSIDTG